MARFATVLLVATLLTSACGSSDVSSDSTEIAASTSGGEVTIRIERPSRPDIPWAETPEQIRSNEQCPDDLQVDSIVPVTEPTVSLTQVAEIAEASALAFAPDGTASVPGDS